MSIDEINKVYVSQFIEPAIELLNSKRYLTISMLERKFDIQYQLAALLYEMVDEKIKGEGIESYQELFETPTDGKTYNA